MSRIDGRVGGLTHDHVTCEFRSFSSLSLLFSVTGRRSMFPNFLLGCASTSGNRLLQRTRSCSISGFFHIFLLVMGSSTLEHVAGVPRLPSWSSFLCGVFDDWSTHDAVDSLTPHSVVEGIYGCPPLLPPNSCCFCRRFARSPGLAPSFSEEEALMFFLAVCPSWQILPASFTPRFEACWGALVRTLLLATVPEAGHTFHVPRGVLAYHWRLCCRFGSRGFFF